MGYRGWAGLAFLCACAPQEPSCEEILQGHNRQEQRFDLVFVGVNYSVPEARKKTLEGIEEILHHEFLGEHADAFNFWFVPESVYITPGQGEWGKEGDASIRALASRCHVENPYIIAFENWGFRANSDIGAWADAPLLTETLVCTKVENACQGCAPGIIRFPQTAQAHVLLHELGHLVFGLEDEYVDESMASPPARQANCFFGTQEECESRAPWKDLIGKTGRDGQVIACYEGCAYRASGAFRPVRSTTMENQDHVGFGLYNEMRMCKVINIVTQKKSAYCKNLISSEYATSFP